MGNSGCQSYHALQRSRDRDMSEAMLNGRRNLLFVYWGRHGLNAFVHETMQAMLRRCDVGALLSLSRHNADLALFATMGDAVTFADLFANSLGAINVPRILSLRQHAANLVKERGITDVVTLMPHVWSSAVSSAYRAAGARYHTIIHDAVRHPGDGTGLILPLLLRDARSADTVFALSNGVAAELRRQGRVDDARIRTLFHPFTGRARAPMPAPAPGEPWRFAFLGRIMTYKGLPLFVDAMTRLRSEGRAVQVSVMGEGPLGPEADRLAALGAHVLNRWLDEAEIANALQNHHAIVLSHIEASQSGVAASALGAGLPVIATPVGGIREQVRHGETGLLAREVSAASLADAAREMMDTNGLHQRLVAGAVAARAALSPDAFADALLSALTERRS